MKFLKYLYICIAFILLCGCNQNTNHITRKEQPVLQISNIDCVVTKCDYQYWYASGCYFKAYVTIKNDKYNLEKSYTFDGMDAKEFETIKNGDIVSCELNTYVLESTNEIVKRELGHIN